MAADGFGSVLHTSAGLAPSVGGPYVSIPSDVRCSELAGYDAQLLYLTSRSGSPGIDSTSTLLGGAIGDADVVPLVGPALLAAPSFRWGMLSPREAAVVARRSARAGLVHVHGVYNVIGLWAALWARCRGVPVVITPREQLTSFDRGDSGRVRRVAKTLYASALLRLSRSVVFTSELERQQSRVPGRARQHVLWHAVPEESAPVQRRLDGEYVRLGFVGRFHEKKNLGALLEALSLLPERFVLRIAGGEQAELDEIAADRLMLSAVAPRVDFVGFVSGEAKSQFLDEIDLLVMPSQFECFGMAAAEALVRGVPVVVSETSGIAEVLARAGGGGVAVRADAHSIAQGVLELSEPTRHSRESRAAIEGCRPLLSDRAHAEGLGRVYAELRSS